MATEQLLNERLQVVVTDSEGDSRRFSYSNLKEGVDAEHRLAVGEGIAQLCDDHVSNQIQVNKTYMLMSI